MSSKKNLPKQEDINDINFQLHDVEIDPDLEVDFNFEDPALLAELNILIKNQPKDVHTNSGSDNFETDVDLMDELQVLQCDMQFNSVKVEKIASSKNSIHEPAAHSIGETITSTVEFENNLSGSKVTHQTTTFQNKKLKYHENAETNSNSVDLTSILSSANIPSDFNADNVEVEVTDEDMNDPLMLAQLDDIAFSQFKSESKSSELSNQNNKLDKENDGLIPVKLHTAVDLDKKFLLQRQQEYKAMALQLSKNKEKVLAREMLSVKKSLDKILEILNYGGTLPSNFKLPPSPQEYLDKKSANSVSVPPLKTINSFEPESNFCKTSTPSKITKKPLVTSTVPPTGNLSSKPEDGKEGLEMDSSANVYEYLISKLRNQLKILSGLSDYHLKSNAKALAHVLLNMRKNLKSDIERLEVLSKSPTNNQPPFFQTKSFEYEVTENFLHLASDDLEVNILSGSDFNTSCPGVEYYCTFNLGWPVDDKYSDSKFETNRVYKCTNPEFNSTKILKIQRNSKAFQRHLERKKVATIDIFCAKQQSFSSRLFGSTPTLIGKCFLPLDQLLTKAEISEQLTVMDPSNVRKRLSAKLDIKLRLRQPIVKPSIIVKNVVWVMVNFYENLFDTNPVYIAINENSTNLTNFNSVPNKKITPPATPSKKITPPATPSKILPSKDTVVSKVEKKNITPNSKSLSINQTNAEPVRVIDNASEEDDIETLEFNFNNPDTMRSNYVIESEYNETLAEIKKFETNGKPIPEELTTKKIGLEIRMQLLITSVQTGALSMEGHLANCKNDVLELKKLTLRFMHHGRKDLAKLALKRTKIVEKEVTDISNEILQNQT
ncbi:hypothetical protein HDU92_004070 [Lobulomyces angularis]|nr:hypothetical protein HDU92_004070 [Lobulomyces angularis]